MRTRTLKRNVQNQVKKEVEKLIKTLVNDFHTNKKGLMEVFGLVSTQSLKIEEFEEKEDFAIAGKEIKTVYTKMKNDLGRLYFELTKRKEMANMKIIQYHVSDITRAKILNKFEEFRNLEKEYIKNTMKALPTALEMGIPQAWMDFFNSVELVAECIKDYIDYDTFTAKEKHYMRRSVTYATKYIKMIENEF